MNLFEPPVAEEVHRPATLRRVGWSLSRGVLLGMGLAALLFAMAWGGRLFESEGYDPWVFLAWSLPLGALELWIAAKAFASNRAFSLFVRIAAVALAVTSAVYLFKLTRAMRFTDWAQAQPEFVTLVAVCGVVGLLAVRGGLRLWLTHRSRISLWVAATVAVWFSSEWAVKLGTVVDAWRDPRVDIAYNTMILTGVLGVICVLTLMDWHIRRRDADTIGEDAPSEQGGGLNNG